MESPLSDLISLAIPILSALVIGFTGFLVKLALSDRDARLDHLENSDNQLCRIFNELNMKVAVLENQNAHLLREAEKLSEKIDNLGDI